MKRILTFTLLLIVTFAKAQTLEFSTPNNLISGKEHSSLYLGRLTAGDKIVKIQTSAAYGDSSITIYNSDYSIYKTFTIPQISGNTLGCIVNHISDNLFNNDSKVEVGCMCNYSIYLVYADDGTKISKEIQFLQK